MNKLCNDKEALNIIKKVRILTDLVETDHRRSVRHEVSHTNSKYLTQITRYIVGMSY